MKNISALWYILFFGMVAFMNHPLPCAAQTIQYDSHYPISTDSIILYAIPYRSMTDSGMRCVWDLGRIEERAERTMTLDFFPTATDNVSWGVHCVRQNRYFRYANDTLYYVGKETTRQKTTLEKPVPILKYPFVYGDTILRHFCSMESYAHKRTFAMEGNLSVIGKAAGILIVSGDTIGSALYVETIERYKKIHTDTLNIACKTGQWYIEAVRYPIVVSCQWLCNDSSIYAQMWYYPIMPPRNRKQRQRKPENQTETIIQETKAGDVQLYYTNPASEKLTIRYVISENTYIRFSLYSYTGTRLYQSHRIYETEGTWDIPMKHFPQGAYMLHIETNDSQISREIIKQ